MDLMVSDAKFPIYISNLLKQKKPQINLRFFYYLFW